MKERKPFIFRTSFNPIHGIDEDLNAFMQKFEANGSIRFTRFSELWRREKFIHIIYGWHNQSGLCDILGCIFYRLVDLVQPRKEQTHLRRICALYLLYAFHGKQPVKNLVRIRVCPNSWRGLLQLVDEARDDGHLDVYYVLHQLCAANAFHFCAIRQILYPGAPLFESPQMKSENLQGLSKNVSKNPLSSYLPLLEAPRSSQIQLHESIDSLNASIKEYTTAKALLGKIQIESTQTESQQQPFNSAEFEDSKEEFLPGLNFITQPNSLQKLSGIIEELDEEHRFFEKNLVGQDSPRKKARVTRSSGITVPSVASNSDCTSSRLEAGFDGTHSRSKRPNNSPDPVELSDNRCGCSSSTSHQEVDNATDDVGDRRRLLKQPCTWKSELDKQTESVRLQGCRRNRSRPTESKLPKLRSSTN